MTQCPTCSSPVDPAARFCSACGYELPALSSTPTRTAVRRARAAAAGVSLPPRGRFIPGTVLAERYRVVERVGQGGMGEVYRADDLKLGERVALKFLPEDFEHEPDRLKRLFYEVSTARRVSHPNVCRVYDVADVDGVHFLSMEFVDGEDLASLLRRIGSLKPDKAVQIGREICLGLAAIHERGLVHRDLKPANVMIDGRGTAKITDFGLAELQGEVGEPDEVTGTPAYMAPEVLIGGAPTAASDIYSLGLVLYETFTGKRAFDGSFETLVRERRERTPTTPSAHVRDLDPAAERLIMRCLEADPSRRPPSARAAAAALPGGDPIAAALAAGETPSPELVVEDAQAGGALHPAAGWACLAALIIGLATLMAVAPSARVVPAVPLPEPPAVMAARARDVIRGLGLPVAAGDHAHGFAYDAAYVEYIEAHDPSRSRWERLSRPQPPAVIYWYRQSPRELIPPGRTHTVGYSDPPLRVPGMVGVQTDGLGRLRRLDVVPAGGAEGPADSTGLPLRQSRLFTAAGLDTAAYRAVAPRWLPPHYADERAAWERRGAGETPQRIEAAWWHGRPVFFAALEPWSPEPAAPSPLPTETTWIGSLIRPVIIVVAFLLGAYLARRNLRAGRADRKRAFRMASILMGMRLLVWLLDGHHTPSGLSEQFAIALAWSLYDFAYLRIFYVAVEPYVRRLWPRMLVGLLRLLDGRHRDSTVGRDLLIGSLLGTATNLAVALHQRAPLLFGAPPGRPDNVGYVEPALSGLAGLSHQLATDLVLTRSAIVHALGFIVILVVARILLRHTWLSIAVTFVLFVPLAMPRGEFIALNLALAIFSLATMLAVLMRFGLLAVTTGLASAAILEAAVLHWNLGLWTAGGGLMTVLVVAGVGTYGFFRALGGNTGITSDPARA